MAWLKSPPKGWEVNRYAHYTKEDPEHPALELPYIEYGEHLIGYLHEVGFCRFTGMGVEELSFLEIKAWCEATSTVLEPWESLALRDLSSAYLYQYRESENPAAPAPYIGGSVEVRRQQTDSFFRNLKANHNGRHRNAKRKGNE